MRPPTTMPVEQTGGILCTKGRARASSTVSQYPDPDVLRQGENHLTALQKRSYVVFCQAYRYPGAETMTVHAWRANSVTLLALAARVALRILPR